MSNECKETNKSCSADHCSGTTSCVDLVCHVSQYICIKTMWEGKEDNTTSPVVLTTVLGLQVVFTL